MCGVAGFWDPGGRHPDWEAEVRAMTGAVRHRGPDDEGTWLDPATGVALGHRRLAVLDLSVHGHQPMVSPSGRYVLSFNGEVYNFAELRERVERSGARFRGRSDTEVLAGACDRWGVLDALRACAGMFAVAIWDREARALSLARDRVGEKPLYYGWQGGVLLFGSELGALRAHSAWRAEIDPDIVPLYVRHHYVPAPYSIFRGVRKVRPGTVLTIRDGDPRQVDEQTYWSALGAVSCAGSELWDGSDDEAVGQLDALLRRIVAQQSVADVPVGAFLSGGTDSSLVAALMQAQASRPVRTFTIGFPDAGFDEAGCARAVAAHLGTVHTELYVTSSEVLAAVPSVARVYDEPLGDPAAVPTQLLATLARSQVTVSLSGDGGDELFAGYAHYGRAARLWRWLQPVPTSIRRSVTSVARAATRRMEAERLRTSTPRAPRAGDRADRIGAALTMLDVSSFELMYREVVSQCREPRAICRAGTAPATVFGPGARWPEARTPTERMMYCDLVSYLPDDILVKVDRATMHVALESRAPLIDHRVVEFAWRLPLGLKVREGRGKWLLRRLLHAYVPPALVERPKHGFRAPVAAWLRGPLRSWAGDLLSPDRLARSGIWNVEAVTDRWARHLRGERRHHRLLWGLLMFEAWREAACA
jgi:asparagine synthase (glutamine-hydrolysing)